MTILLKTTDKNNILFLPDNKSDLKKRPWGIFSAVNLIWAIEPDLAEVEIGISG